MRRLGESGLPFEACVRSWQLSELEELAAACSDTVIVLDHAGKPHCGAGVASWLTALRALARHPNIRCKLSGLATEAAPHARPSALQAAPRAALDAFGADRWADPEDLAGAAVFLASRASDCVHGAIVPVDGGWLGR